MKRYAFSVVQSSLVRDKCLRIINANLEFVRIPTEVTQGVQQYSTAINQAIVVKYLPNDIAT